MLMKRHPHWLVVDLTVRNGDSDGDDTEDADEDHGDAGVDTEVMQVRNPHCEEEAHCTADGTPPGKLDVLVHSVLVVDQLHGIHTRQCRNLFRCWPCGIAVPYVFGLQCMEQYQTSSGPIPHPLPLPS